MKTEEAEERPQTVQAIWDSFNTRDYGGKFVFFDKRSGNYDIYIENRDLTERTWLTSGKWNDTFPRLSRDGSKIVFYSDRVGDDEVFVMNSDGTRQINLAIGHSFKISADGSKVLFSSNRAGRGGLYIIHTDGTSLTQLTDDPDAMMASFNHDTTKIVFAPKRDSNWEIYVVNADGTGETNLTNSPDQQETVDYFFEDGGRSHDSPKFTLDGSKIVFKKDSDEKTYVMNPDGSGLAEFDTSPYWDKLLSIPSQEASPSEYVVIEMTKLLKKESGRLTP